MKKTRGLRNNNPLNIRRNKTAWRGLATVQNDKEFFCFTAPEWGYRAAFITLRNYRRLHRLQTLSEWIARWAPPIENDTAAYVRCVCVRCRLASDYIPNINNKKEMCDIVSSMSFMENGVPAIESDVEKGWLLAVAS